VITRVKTRGDKPAEACSMFEPVLARLRDESDLHLGTAHSRLVPVEYEERPFSHLLRVGVCRNGAASPESFLFVKLFKPKPEDTGGVKMRERVAHDFDVSRRIFAALDSPAGAGAVRPIACYLEHLAIVSEQADGQTLMQHIDGHARWFPTRMTRRQSTETLEAVGRWLRAFQAIEPPAGPVALTDLRAYVDVRLRRLCDHGVWSNAVRQTILQHLDALAAHVADRELASVLIHADLALGNVLVAGKRVVVLDFAMVQRGCSLHDITRLYVQLDVLRAKPPFRSVMVRELQTALLRGFDPALTAARPLFRYLTMLHRVNHLGTLSLNRERFLANAFSRRVRRLHRAWIEGELTTGAVADREERL
jgi:aminoglycoside phosphotransferase (APT) family kinase protein